VVKQTVPSTAPGGNDLGGNVAGENPAGGSSLPVVQNGHAPSSSSSHKPFSDIEMEARHTHC